jgi:hypothetical protein
MTSRLTVITGPVGVDIGPVAAHLGRDLDDGLAIRVVTPATQPHTSPDPFHSPIGHARTGPGPRGCGAVRLDCLPSAWQDPQTNLGVVYPGYPDLNLHEGLHTLDALGLNPAHRLTVQHGTGREHPVSIPHPVEVGNLGVIARDSVLRAGGRVQVEAGDGQTFLSALATVGIPPWAEWIGHLDRWIVLDVAAIPGDRHADQLLTRTIQAIRDTVNALDGSSGAYTWGGHAPGPTLRVALFNGQMIVAGTAGHEYNAATGDGDEISERAATLVVKVLDAVADATGVEVHLFGTGHVDGTGMWSWIDSGERGNDDTWGL